VSRVRGPQLPSGYATGDDRNRLTGQDEADESKNTAAAPAHKAREDHGSSERLDRLDVDDWRLVGRHHGHLLPDTHSLMATEIGCKRVKLLISVRCNCNEN